MNEYFPPVDNLKPQISVKDIHLSPFIYGRSCSMMSCLNSVMLGGQAAVCTISVVFGQCCSHDSQMSQRKPNVISTQFPGPQIPLNTGHCSHIHTLLLINQGQICVSVCVTNIKRDKLPEHLFLFDTHMLTLSC